MTGKGENRFLIGVLMFIVEYGVISILSVILQFSSDFIFRMVTLYFILQIIFGHYRASTLLIWEEVRLLLLSHLCFFLVTLLLVPLIAQCLELILLLIVVTIGMFVFDVLVAQLMRHMLYKSLSDKVLIIGTGEDAFNLYKVCRANRFSMMNITTFIQMEGQPIHSELYKIIKEKGIEIKTKDKLNSILDQKNIDQVIIAEPTISKNDIDKLMEVLHLRVKKIKYIPLANGLVTFDAKVEDYDGLLVVSSSRNRNFWPLKIMKRIIDIIGGIVGCIFLIPLSLYVRRKNHKHGDYEPMFFIQERIGKDGKPFKIYKYRTMVPNAEQQLNEMMEADPAIKEEYETNKKLANDPRITEAGKFLRAKSLDEMPQLINVLKGEMSLVGPRPYLLREADDMGIYYDSVVRCKPGITGMWQSHGRSDVSFEDRCKLDDYYYSNWNLWLDIIILIKTIKVVLYGKGAV